MKKIISTVLILAVLPILVLLPSSVTAYEDCPYGLVDDPYPGECGRYVDNNSDALCDHSQSESEVLGVVVNPTSISSENITTAEIQETRRKSEKTYHLIPITILVSLLYFTTRILSNKKKISKIIHKAIWNSILLVAFTISGLLAVLLIIKINFGIVYPFSFDVLFWHVESGIFMLVISIYHIIERWYFFKNLFKYK